MRLESSLAATTLALLCATLVQAGADAFDAHRSEALQNEKSTAARLLGGHGREPARLTHRVAQAGARMIVVASTEGAARVSWNRRPLLTRQRSSHDATDMRQEQAWTSLTRQAARCSLPQTLEVP